MGGAPTPDWLDTAGVHAHLLGRKADSIALRRLARMRYAQLVEAGRGSAHWAEALRQQICLGDAACVARVLAHGPPAAASRRARALTKVPR